MSTLAAIIYSTDHAVYTGMALMRLRYASDPKLTELVVIDNGSSQRFDSILADEGDRLIRYEENIGGNAVFHRWLEDNWFEDDLPDYLAFLHCDLMVHEKHWDERVIAAFEADPKLDLLGFVGSTKIDALGGRGDGTMLNYTGAAFEELLASASPAEHHGRRTRTLEAAAVVDHCAMVFRRTTLQQLPPQEGRFAPEHFYDRILSCEVLRRGGHIAVLGIECDHFSGGIGPGVLSADALRRKWLEQEGIAYDPEDSYTAVYLESEKRFFAEYRGFFPLSVDPEYGVHPG